jgi:heptose I phosphotransferase
MLLHGWLQRLKRGERRFRHRSDWLRFAGNDFADHIMTVPVTDRQHRKQGRSIGRWVLRRGEEQLVVYLKRHFTAPLWRRVLALLWPQRSWSPARVEWRRLRWARAHGIPVALPVAVGEFIGPGLSLQSFLAVEELTGMLPLNEAIPRAAAELSAQDFRAWKGSVSAQIARQARVLHDRCRFHKDMYLCHFYVRPAQPSGAPSTVHMIDLHRLSQHRFTSWWWQVKDLAQLLYSSDLPGVNSRDRLHFLHQYLGQPKLSRDGRRLLRLVLAKAWLYRRHNLKHAAKKTPKPLLVATPPTRLLRPSKQETQA